MAEVAVLLLIAGSAAVAGIARRFGWSSPILLVVVGLAASYIPGIPNYTLNPDLVLLVILPPLLYAAALDSSYLSIRHNLRPIALLSVGLVLFTVLTVGLAAHAVVAGMTLATAFTLGAIVAPPDAVSALAIGREVGMPRRLLVILGGESLANDATALTVYGVAVSAVVGGGYSIASGIGLFFYAAVVGAAIGLSIAYVVRWLIEKLGDPILENALSLITPFVVYLPAVGIKASGVLAVVCAGVYLGYHATRTVSYATRLQSRTLWGMIEFVLSSAVFALIGLQLRGVIRDLTGSTSQTIIAVVVVVAVVLVSRPVWVFPATYLPRRFSARLRGRDPAPSWQVPAVLSWAGTRGVVTLAAAFALPLTTHQGSAFPQRNLILFVAFAVVLVTLVVQGLSLPWVSRKLGVIGQESTQDNLTEAAAQNAAAQAALGRLDELLATEEGAQVPEDVVDRLRQLTENRSLAAWERLGGEPGTGYVETPAASYRRLRREMLETERSTFVRLRDAGRIDDEVLRRVQRELDLEEAQLARDYPAKVSKN